MRREHRLRERAFREREGAFESKVWWYRWDDLASQMHDVYDESGDRRYHPRANVPPLWWFDAEGGDVQTGEGRHLDRAMTMAVTVGSLRNAGILPEPDDRVNDLILFRGWWWDILGFEATSQSSAGLPYTHFRPGDDATVRIVSKRRFPLSDMPLDVFPPITGVVYPDPESGSQ